MSETAGPRHSGRTWRPPPLIGNRHLRYAIYAGALIYLMSAVATVPFDWDRIVRGLARADIFLQGFLSPDFSSRWTEIYNGMLESITITIVATAIGVVLSIPFGLGAARNLVPAPVYMVCRGVIAVSRAFQEVVIAIFFVAMFGFGPFAGMLTLAFATIGFLGKLLAEDIEATNPEQMEAIRATGASWPQIVVYAIQPQVMARLIGLSIYRLDINFRESAVIGLVGAGGIGMTLNTAMSRYEYDVAAAILIVIIAIVMVVEYTSGFARRRML